MPHWSSIHSAQVPFASKRRLYAVPSLSRLCHRGRLGAMDSMLALTGRWLVFETGWTELVLIPTSSCSENGQSESPLKECSKDTPVAACSVDVIVTDDGHLPRGWTPLAHDARSCNSALIVAAVLV